MGGSFGLEALLHEEEDEVLDAVGVAPLVVVPADYFAGVVPTTLVRRESKMEESGLPLKSELTSSSSCSRGCP